MKAAKHWIDGSDSVLNTESLIKWIEAIQEDAHRDGMTKAAEIVGLLGFYDEGMPKIVDAILKARDNKAVWK